MGVTRLGRGRAHRQYRRAPVEGTFSERDLGPDEYPDYRGALRVIRLIQFDIVN
jgi:hypothetical protein